MEEGEGEEEREEEGEGEGRKEGREKKEISDGVRAPHCVNQGILS